MAESPETGSVQRIDIRRIFHEKNPGMARMIPGFVYRYLERILHQEEINEFMERHGEKGGLEFIEGAFEDFNTTMVVNGEENIPAEGRYIFVSNHPLGGFDGIMLIHLLRRHYPKVIVLVNDILMNIRNLQEFFVPVNKLGGQARDNVKMIDDTYRSDAQLLSFPSGAVSRRTRGVIRDLVWQKSFIVKAVQYQRDVVPIHVSGRNTNRFYRVSNIRKFLRIGWNLEMFFLPDETFRHRDKTFTFTVGKPIPYSTFDRSFKPIEWAGRMKDLVYRLPGEEDPSLPEEE
jgi:hypothetical protein